MTKEETLEQAQTAFIRARIRLLSSHPFWAYLVMKLDPVWNEARSGGISSTDGRHIYMHPANFLALPKEEQVSVLVHEATHCAAGHLSRCESRDPRKFNIAGDIYIANMLRAEKFAELTAGERFMQSIGVNVADFRELTTEAIYDKLPDPPKQKGKPQCGCGNGEGGCYKPMPTPAERSAIDAEWKQNVIEAGQMAGNTAGAWQELVKTAMPRPPWHLKLFEYLNRGLGGEQSWDALNRRYVWQGLYLPCDTRLVMGEIAVAVDTSGSMSSEQLTEAFGYIRGFRDQHPCKLHLIQCDYDVPGIAAGHKVYEEFETLPESFEVYGRGGTSFDPPFKLLREKRIEPKVLIYITDAFGECRERKPPYSVLWVVLRGDKTFKPPFGEAVFVD